MIGKFTAANKKFQEKRWRPNSSCRQRRPQHGILVPSGPVKTGPDGDVVDEYGMIEKDAPVSTRNFC
jgi:hypothetical protein